MHDEQILLNGLICGLVVYCEINLIIWENSVSYRNSPHAHIEPNRIILYYILFIPTNCALIHKQHFAKADVNIYIEVCLQIEHKQCHL
jgi:hypothetical protein